MSRVYVGNLDPRATERELEDEFRVYGVLRRFNSLPSCLHGFFFTESEINAFVSWITLRKGWTSRYLVSVFPGGHWDLLNWIRREMYVVFLEAHLSSGFVLSFYFST
jgi:RNA recognition motif-containing protein